MISKGIFKPNPKGFGFIETNNKESIFIPPKQAKLLFIGDIIEVEAVQNDDLKWTALSVNVLETPRRRFAATAVKKENGWLAVSENNIPTVGIFQQEKHGLQENERVIVEAKLTPNGWSAEIVERLGLLHEPRIESKISKAIYKIPDTTLSMEIQKPNTDRYADLRHIPFVTIDDASTTDVDDAIAVETNQNGLVLHVAIADVAAYVAEGSTEDRHAFERGTTVYFAQENIPMLPRSLSSGVASLTPDTDKLAIVVSIHLNTLGDVTNTIIQEGLVRSRSKLNYDEVTSAIETQKHPLLKELNALEQAYSLLLSKRIQRGAAPIRDGDYRFKLDEHGKVVNVTYKPWQLAYGMVEESMLAANSAVGAWLANKGIPAIYRHHKGLDTTAWSEYQPYLEALGLFSGEMAKTPVELMLLSEQAKSIGEETGMENAIRSAMRPASYQVNETSHFSLAYAEYTHFTSPIRRYADLTVHRLIKKALAGEPSIDIAQLNEIAKQCSFADQRAKKATREEAKRLKIQWTQTLASQSIDVQLTGGNNAGWFLKNTALCLETFVALPNAARAEWAWDNVLQRARNIKTNETIKQGDTLPLVIQGVDTLKFQVRANSPKWSPQLNADVSIVDLTV